MKVYMRLRSDEGWQEEILSVFGGDGITVSDKKGDWVILRFGAETRLEELNWLILNVSARILDKFRQVQDVALRLVVRYHKGTPVSRKEK